MDDHLNDTPPPPEPPVALFDRVTALDVLATQLRQAWRSFDAARPAEPALPPDLAARLAAPLPEEGDSIEAAMADAARTLDASVSPSRPLMVGYIPSTGLEAGVLAESLVAAYDVNMAASAGAVEAIVDQALAWLSALLGYPMATGVFTSGGMVSNLTAILAAREHALPGSRVHGVDAGASAVYVSAEAHHSVIRAVEVAGLGSACVRAIPLDEQRRMRVDDLASSIDVDVANGVTPVAVVATAGTTLTGAVDPLDRIADVCAARDVWLHVDGAYGAPGAAAPSRRHLFVGLERADSLTVDVHKWLGVQKACSVVLLSRAGALTSTFRHEESYLLHDEDTSHHVDRTLEYSRPVRALKPWMAIRTHGAAQFRAWLDHTVSLADALATRLRQADDFELLHDPPLTTICFRHLAPDGVNLDAHNAALARAVVDDGRVYLAPAALDGRVCIRVTLVNYRTTHQDLDTILGTIRDCASRLLAEVGAT